VETPLYDAVKDSVQDVVKIWSKVIVIGNDVVVALHGFVFIKKAPYRVLTFSCFLYQLLSRSLQKSVGNGRERHLESHQKS
jgi:hypothetical protein